MTSNGMMSSPSSSYFPQNFLLQLQQAPPDHDPQEHHHHHLHPHHNPFLPSSQCPSLQDFRGTTPPMLGTKRPAYGGDGELSGCVGGGNEDDEQSDDGGGSQSQQAGEKKKRRLNTEQVRTLERSFELGGNKLEPERKLQLARALGLRPRQVAVWFQNRRARWKTKQLEKDHHALKRRLDAVKADNDALISRNKKLQAEILALKGGSREAAAGSELINQNKDTTEASCSENSSEINLDASRTLPSEHQHAGNNRGGMIPFYPSVGRPAAGVHIDVHLLHSSSDQHGNGRVLQVPETASFRNLLCGVDDEPPPFWPWPDHQHFH